MVLLQVFAIAIIMVSQVTEAWAEPFQISKIEFFAKIVTCSPLTFGKVLRTALSNYYQKLCSFQKLCIKAFSE